MALPAECHRDFNPEGGIMRDFILVCMMVIFLPLWVFTFVAFLVWAMLETGWNMGRAFSDWLIENVHVGNPELIGQKLVECPQCGKQTFSKLWGDCENCSYQDDTL
jgi:hypothetical protein